MNARPFYDRETRLNEKGFFQPGLISPELKTSVMEKVLKFSEVLEVFSDRLARVLLLNIGRVVGRASLAYGIGM